MSIAAKLAQLIAQFGKWASNERASISAKVINNDGQPEICISDDSGGPYENRCIRLTVDEAESLRDWLTKVLD